MVELGASLDPSETGGSPIVVGGCGNPPVPIVSYTDSVQSMTRKRNIAPRNIPTPVKPVLDDGAGEMVWGSMYEILKVYVMTSKGTTYLGSVTDNI
jgi:hypothetical protein